MFPFRKILFPVDYSAPCEAVVPYLSEIAQRFSASITLVHAYGLEELAHSELALNNPDEVRTFGEERLRNFALDKFPRQQVDTFTGLGEAGSVIHNLVQRQGTDLVMLATHGRGQIRRFLLGSVAAKVLHDVSAAVWTGTGAILTNHTPQIPYRSVLCALDESEEAEGVLRFATSFSSRYEAKLSLVQIIERPPLAMEIDYGPYKKDIMDAADARLRELKGQVGVDAPHAVLDATISNGVREESVRRNADLIILGRGCAQGTFRILSHVYPVIRESPCPVLSI